MQQQFFAPRAGEENVDGRINPLVADFAVEHHFHIAGALKFLKDQFVHAAASFDQRRGDNSERAGFLGITSCCENFTRYFHGARIDTAAHGSTSASHRIIECTGRARD